VVINCSEFDNRQEISKHFKYYHINIPDYGIPTENQIREFFNITDKHNNNGEPIVVHCVAGCGRTGIMVIAWAAHNRIIPKDLDPVDWIRKLRPCSLETEEQMDFARKILKKYQK
jgi:atypical dual specificity phosphatase